MQFPKILASLVLLLVIFSTALAAPLPQAADAGAGCDASDASCLSDAIVPISTPNSTAPLVVGEMFPHGYVPGFQVYSADGTCADNWDYDLTYGLCHAPGSLADEYSGVCIAGTLAFLVIFITIIWVVNGLWEHGLTFLTSHRRWKRRGKKSVRNFEAVVIKIASCFLVFSSIQLERAADADEFEMEVRNARNAVVQEAIDNTRQVAPPEVDVPPERPRSPPGSIAFADDDPDGSIDIVRGLENIRNLNGPGLCLRLATYVGGVFGLNTSLSNSEKPALLPVSAVPANQPAAPQPAAPQEPIARPPSAKLKPVVNNRSARHIAPAPKGKARPVKQSGTSPVNYTYTPFDNRIGAYPRLASDPFTPPHTTYQRPIENKHSLMNRFSTYWCDMVTYGHPGHYAYKPESSEAGPSKSGGDKRVLAAQSRRQLAPAGPSGPGGTLGESSPSQSGVNPHGHLESNSVIEPRGADSNEPVLVFHHVRTRTRAVGGRNLQDSAMVDDAQTKAAPVTTAYSDSAYSSQGEDVADNAAGRSWSSPSFESSSIMASTPKDYGQPIAAAPSDPSAFGHNAAVQGVEMQSGLPPNLSDDVGDLTPVPPLRLSRLHSKHNARQVEIRRAASNPAGREKLQRAQRDRQAVRAHQIQLRRAAYDRAQLRNGLRRSQTHRGSLRQAFRRRRSSSLSTLCTVQDRALLRRRTPSIHRMSPPAAQRHCQQGIVVQVSPRGTSRLVHPEDTQRRYDRALCKAKQQRKALAPVQRQAQQGHGGARAASSSAGQRSGGISAVVQAAIDQLDAAFERAAHGRSKQSSLGQSHHHGYLGFRRAQDLGDREGHEFENLRPAPRQYVQAPLVATRLSRPLPAFIDDAFTANPANDPFIDQPGASVSGLSRSQVRQANLPQLYQLSRRDARDRGMGQYREVVQARAVNTGPAPRSSKGGHPYRDSRGNTARQQPGNVHQALYQLPVGARYLNVAPVRETQQTARPRTAGDRDSQGNTARQQAGNVHQTSCQFPIGARCVDVAPVHETQQTARPRTAGEADGFSGVRRSMNAAKLRMSGMSRQAPTNDTARINNPPILDPRNSWVAGDERRFMAPDKPDRPDSPIFGPSDGGAVETVQRFGSPSRGIRNTAWDNVSIHRVGNMVTTRRRVLLDEQSSRAGEVDYVSDDQDDDFYQH